MDDDKMKNKKLRVGIIYFSVILIILLLVNYGLNSVRNQEVTYSEFKQMVRDQKVEEVKISADGEIKFQIKGDEIVTYNCVATENATTITAFLEEYKVSKYDGYVAQMNIWVSLLIQFGIPLVAIFLLWHFISKSMSRGMGDAMSFGKSNAKIYGENETGITFADVAGEDEAKDSLEEIVDLLHNPQKYAEIGARLPKGALLVDLPSDSLWGNLTQKMSCDVLTFRRGFSGGVSGVLHPQPCQQSARGPCARCLPGAHRGEGRVLCAGAHHVCRRPCLHGVRCFALRARAWPCTSV